MNGTAGKNNRRNVPGARRAWTIREKKRRSFKMKYTKGEWETIYHAPGNIVQHGIAGYSIRAEEGIAYNISREANAHLISAAPDMYEALKALLDEYQITDEDTEINVSANWVRAFKAISKAEGKV